VTGLSLARQPRTLKQRLALLKRTLATSTDGAMAPSSLMFGRGVAGSAVGWAGVFGLRNSQNSV
jgi:hypothetical protein